MQRLPRTSTEIMHDWRRYVIMKQEYKGLEIEILNFASIDVIVTSEPDVGEDGLPFEPHTP